MTIDFPAIIRNSDQMRGSTVLDLVNIDLEHKDITLPVWTLDLDSPAWLFRRSRRDGNNRQRGFSVGAEELRQDNCRVFGASKPPWARYDEACMAQECHDVGTFSRTSEQVDSKLHGLGW
jgi:hypothetical protein